MWGISHEMGRPPIISKGWGEGVCTFLEGKPERGEGENKKSQDARMEMGNLPVPLWEEL